MEVSSYQSQLGRTFPIELDVFEGTVLSNFKKQVDKIPHHYAVKMGTQNLTYKELDLLSDQLAANLISLNLKPDSPVGILLPRSLEFIISVIGILKAGGGFVPMSPTDGEERLFHIIKDCECPIILTQGKYLKKNIDLFNTEVIEIEFKDGVLEGLPNLPFSPEKIKPENLAYIIYTSGTTGLPKGAMIEHRNLFWLISNYVPQLTPGDKTLQSMSTTCDASIVEIFPALCGGAMLVLWQDNFAELIGKEEITHTCLTPSMAEIVDPADCKHLRYLILGGEKLTEDVVKKFPPTVTIFNGYGPTECTVACSNTLISDPNRIHIGGKLNLAELYVADPNTLTLNTTNQIGELLIGGQGVGRGYWKNPELTNKKFIPNPFGNGTVYRTGDLVKWNNLGDLEFIGRADRQIKIRGYRLELDGVEGTINQFTGITGSFLVVSNQNLIAYITPKNIDLEKLKLHLQKNLPKHALPSKYFLMDCFPINAAGKVDVKKLPIWEEPQKENLPLKPEEIKMGELWKTLLKLKGQPISLNDNFFDLGGNSLNAIQLTHILRKEKQNGEIPLKLIYENPELGSFLDSIQNFKIDNREKTNFSFPLLDFLKALPSTLYFVFGWITPAIVFLLLLPKFPFLIYYYLFEVIFFGLFGNKIKPIFQILKNKINLDRFNFEEIKIIDSNLPNGMTGVVLCYHPHGLMDIHSQALERYLFKKDIRFLSTFEKKLFWLPFNRTFLYLLGYVPAVMENYKDLDLKKRNIFTTPGDVAEYLHCGDPATIILSSNKIFFRLALENGLTLIPIYAFETEKAFSFYPNLLKWRDKLKIGVQTLAIVPFSGRFNLPIPYKTISKVVIGTPIKVEKKERPTWDDIQKLADLYTNSLKELYDRHKKKDAPTLKVL